MYAEKNLKVFSQKLLWQRTAKIIAAATGRKIEGSNFYGFVILLFKLSFFIREAGNFLRLVTEQIFPGVVIYRLVK